jgi:pimeloyl-ACP methyl ester carboxylesterase
MTAVDDATAADDVELRLLTLPDGRTLEVHLSHWSTTTTTPTGSGAPRGPRDASDEPPVLVDLHGTPSWGKTSRSTREAAAARGIRVLAPTRPGYSRSDPRPGRSVADVAADLSAVLDALGVGRIVVIGASGGGPHALATAALLGDRVAGVASISGVGPYGAPDLDFLAGMGQENVDEFGAALSGEAGLRTYLEAARPELVGMSAEAIVEVWSSILPPVDRALITGELAADLVESINEALAPGIEGWLEDDLAFVRDWGFDLTDVRCPVSVWQGGVDLMVPPAHGAWLAGHLRGARAHLLPDEGHLSIALGRIGDILDELLDDLEG